MKCLNCGKEMESGYIQSSYLVFFSNKLRKFFLSPNLSKGEDVVLTKNNMLYPNGVAFNCRECKRIVIDYTNIKQEI